MALSGGNKAFDIFLPIIATRAPRQTEIGPDSSVASARLDHRPRAVIKPRTGLVNGEQHRPATGADPLRDKLEREANSGELLGNSPEAACQIGVLCGSGAPDEHRHAAHMHEMTGSGEAVARDVSNSGVQGR